MPGPDTSQGVTLAAPSSSPKSGTVLPTLSSLLSPTVVLSSGAPCLHPSSITGLGSAPPSVTPVSLPMSSVPWHFFRGPFLTTSDPHGSSGPARGLCPQNIHHRGHSAALGRPPSPADKSLADTPGSAARTTLNLGSGGDTREHPALCHSPSLYLLRPCFQPSSGHWAPK